ncbi:MAG: SH3 domain-containing protein, partial [Actinomycetota bacterium]
KPTPKKTPPSKLKTKNPAQTTSKSKASTKVTSKSTSKTKAETNQKTAGKNKKSKTSNARQILTANNKTSSKNSKNTKLTTTSSKNTAAKITKPKTTDKNKIKPPTAKTTKPTTEKPTVKPVVDQIPTKPDTNSAELSQVIVTTVSVPLKSQAKSDAPTLSNVKLGTVLRVTEKNPAWYKVEYSASGKTSAGWVSANSVNDLNASDKTEIYRQIVERNFKPQMDFASAREIYEFLTSVDGELDTSDKSAELELKRLLILRSALKNIPIDKKEASPYKEFITSQDKEIVYSEPAGEWLVVSNRFWDLHNKYKKSAVSDAIAWEAANNPLPGECEGYVNCYLFDMRMRFGEYLNLHPNGKNAPEALKNLTDYLSPIVADTPQKKIYNGPTDVTDRAEFNNLIAELRTIVARLPFVEKEKALQQLRQIAEAYR